MTGQNNLQTLRGFRDFLPTEAKQRQWLTDVIRGVFEMWGYEPIETPTMEYASLFEGQIGEDEKLFFKFTDQGDREVALRYDQTVPTSRILAQYRQELKLPFKRYQIQPVFRAEKPQKGRYREFIQADADIFGVESPVADAEIMALSLDIYKQLGFKKPKLLINDRSLFKGIPYDAIVAIDKIKKIGEDGVIKDMESKGISLNDAKAFLKQVKELKPNETIKVVLDYLKNTGFEEDWYAFEPSIARSFAYSSGPIWEVVIPESSGGSVLGGERYDNLIESISGVNIPATGFGLGLDRTLEAALELGLVPKTEAVAQVLVTIFDENLLGESIQIATKLRDEGITTDIYPNSSDKLGKQMKYANDKQIPFVLILGPDEVKKGIVSLKNMQTGESKTGKLTDLLI
ncbi:histidine--tRNA ligase [Candidatus Roizmanbacteria bacterium CG_4_9_14_0_2_um_filter_39_13]|uniref:Histidine--tRNA ligase n=1 Tax=Candidatus Roizmanbacteria bacterium CG_4_9_14_0_2_um_filter_39_13 TaxID=1974839 RepID=A0A2M8F4H3_9BACT|nr:MAG: histidine--tRNA ligase [Candidatus Roizmanbacteria bacterium CG_4_9_14_0_2_um_filter_39_13]